MAQRSLQDFVHEVNGDSHLRIEHDFGDGFVRLRTSEADRRQAAQDIQCSENIVIELLRNSRDAHSSHVFIAVSKEGERRLITVIDDGDGVPPSMHETIFEPRVTSKLDTSHMDAWGLHGRGMALYSIQHNALMAKVVSSDVKRGCAITVATDTLSLPEKTDQSSFPRFTLSDDGTVNVRGPRNILRTACEFAIEARDDCEVILGSPAEIAASLYSYGMESLSAIERAFCRDRSSLPVAKRLATASDPEDFAEIASEMGIEISSRTARRIMDGQIDEAPSMLERITLEKPNDRSRRGPKAKSSRVKVTRSDAEALAQSLHSEFKALAEQYYLEADVDPRVRVSRDKLTITIPLVERLS